MSNDAMATPGTRLQNFLDRAGFRGFPWKTALVLYTISYGWFWNVRNSYWSDDWWAFYDPGIPRTWARYGLAPWIVFNKWLFDLTGPSFLRLLIFIAFFLSAICFYAISTRFIYLNKRYQKFATLLFLLLPFNSARVTLMTFHYSVSYLLFFSAWYLLIFFRPLQIKLLAAFLFFLSFQMHSLPVFFALPILHLISLESIKSWKPFIIFILKNFYLIFAAPAYWILRWFYWNSKEIGYHNPSLPQLWLLAKILVIPSFIFFVFIALARLRVSKKRDHFYLFAISIFVIFLGLAPYIVFGSFHGPVALNLSNGLIKGYWIYFVGRSSWWSRNLMLQPIGIAFFFCSVFSFLSLKLNFIQLWLQRFLVSFCVILNVAFGFEHIVDYAKQKQIISELKSAGFDRVIVDFVFIDKSAFLNARGREYSIEWRYFIEIAYGSEFAKTANVSTTCRTLEPLRLVIIDGEASYSKALRNWFSKGNFGFSTVILDEPSPCPLGLIENRGRQNQIPLLLYFVDANKEIE